MSGVRVERLDHLGLVAGVCQEIGLAAYLDALARPHGPPSWELSGLEPLHQQVVRLLGAYCEQFYTVAL
jgi:hypothetical protein